MVLRQLEEVFRCFFFTIISKKCRAIQRISKVLVYHSIMGLLYCHVLICETYRFPCIMFV